MSELGAVSGIYRYPVKSMLGEILDRTELGPDGIPGDRAWGVRDEQRADFFVGKRVAALMSCRAWYEDGAATSAPRIALPDGQELWADDTDAAERIGHAIDRDVTLWPVVPEARKGSASTPIDEEEVRRMMAREEGEALPDFSAPEPGLIEFMARGRPFFDAYPLLLLTRTSLATLGAAGCATCSTT